ncbi:MAG: hypothetical protein AAB281_01500 [Actinomycetota bacterium]
MASSVWSYAVTGLPVGDLAQDASRWNAEGRGGETGLTGTLGD